MKLMLLNARYFRRRWSRGTFESYDLTDVKTYPDTPRWWSSLTDEVILQTGTAYTIKVVGDYWTDQEASVFLKKNDVVLWSKGVGEMTSYFNQTYHIIPTMVQKSYTKHPQII